ncbi:preprotein translocase subunit SecY [candidate division SR1 bacterium Aalborg_AAW-1]|nr:preprotein translocase subunit SecY [candidate division SR1 bacterium Aalborg_AAW-1]
MWNKILTSVKALFTNPVLRKKLIMTLLGLAIYRLLVVIPVPFVNVDMLMAQTGAATSSGLANFLMLFGGSLDQFSIVAVGLGPFINASIIVQLLTVVIPHFEELQELGEQGQKQLQIYMRYMTFPFALIQSIGMVFFINSLMGGIIDTTSWATVFFAAFVMAVGAMIVLFLADRITEKGLTNGTSLIIFASIISGIVTQLFSTFTSLTSSSAFWSMLVYVILVVGALTIASIFILKSYQQIPVIYARQGKIQETSKLPIPLNPVGMVPIIFAMAFVSFPYIISQFTMSLGYPSETMRYWANWIQLNFNIYVEKPAVPILIFYFLLIIVFTYFYSLITFNPDKMADNIQQRGGFIPGIRPGNETAQYIKTTLNHLSIWGGAGLALIGIFTYLLHYIPLIQDFSTQVGALPVIVTGSGIIIIVGVIQQLMDKIQTETLMAEYDA